LPPPSLKRSDSADLKLLFFAWVFFPGSSATVFFRLCSDLLPLGLLLLILLVVHAANLSDSGLHAKLLPTT
jgi:hypothetical protein